jgi:hypothetical protein
VFRELKGRIQELKVQQGHKEPKVFRELKGQIQELKGQQEPKELKELKGLKVIIVVR